jgi:hypothetical protein
MVEAYCKQTLRPWGEKTSLLLMKRELIAARQNMTNRVSNFGRKSSLKSFLNKEASLQIGKLSILIIYKCILYSQVICYSPY